MTPAETITAIQSIGLELSATGDRLHLSAGPVAPAPELCQAIRENKAALLELLARSATSPEPSPPAIPEPNSAACDACGLRGRTCPPARYFCARLQTWGHRRGCSETGDIPGDPPPPSAADRASVAFAIPAFGLDGDTPASAAGTPVHHNKCRHADGPDTAPAEPQRDPAGHCPICAKPQPDGADVDPRATGHCRHCWESSGKAIPLQPLPTGDQPWLRTFDNSQAAMMAAKLATLKRGNPTGANQYGKGNPPNGGMSQAAAKAGVSQRSIQWAGLVWGKGATEVPVSVIQGKITLKSAVRLVEAFTDHDAQRAVLELPPDERQDAINHLPISHKLAALGEDCQ